MRALSLSVIALCFVLSSYCQTDSLAAQLEEGVRLHDKGDYAGAIARYDAIIAANDQYVRAYVEKALSLYAATRLQECADWCRQVTKKFSGNENLKHVYVSYGSALDGLGKADEAIKIYKEGIKKFPQFYLLPYNKGLTEYSQKQYEDAIKDCEQAITLNHAHGSSHLLLAYSVYAGNRMASAMALTCFLLVEPRGARAEKSLKMLLKVLGANVEKKDEKTINISLSASALDTKGKGEDNFHMTEVMMEEHADKVDAFSDWMKEWAGK